MKQTESLRILQALGQKLLTTKDAAAALGISSGLRTHLCLG